MLKNFSGARLGIFVFLGTILLFIAIFLIGNKSALFASTFTVKAYFSNIEGLRSGAPVRLSGIDIGSVSGIEIASDTTGRVVVSMEIKKDVQHFIRVDSRAAIETEGLVGVKIVVISVGSSSANIVNDGGIILAKDPVSMAAMIEQGEGTIRYIKEISQDFAEITDRINKGQGTIGRLINDEELYNSATQITQSADKSLNAITGRLEEVSDIIIDLTSEFENIISGSDSLIANINSLVIDVRDGKGLMGALVSEKSTFGDSLSTVLTNLVSTTSGIREGALKFAENMEALKHNWLFKGYFEQRGYWDISEYEQNLNTKISELKQRTRELDEKIKELRTLENSSDE